MYYVSALRVYHVYIVYRECAPRFLYCTPPIKSSFIFHIITRHSIFYRYDVHVTILLIHIHFGSLLVMRWLKIGLKKIIIKK